jgi:uncharacterized protein YjbI with pentapeptide repeats
MPTRNAPIDCREYIGQELAGLRFERVHFDSKFSRSTFRECAFVHCRFDRVLMNKSRWLDSQFDGSKLVIKFDDSVFERCSFRNVTFHGLRGEYGGARSKFIGCDFSSAIFKSVALRATKFEGCVFTATRFTDCDLRGATHDGVPLENIS